MATIYKYYPPSTAKTVLDNASIRFSPLAEFNDPFECYVFPNIDFSIDDFAYEVYLQILDVLEKKETIELHEKSGPLPNLISLYQKGKFPGNISEHDFALAMSQNIRNKKIAISPSEWNKAVHQRLARSIGALCLTETYSNLLMWAHYAQNHEGIVIGFDLDRLHSLSPLAKAVEYADSYPSVKETSNHAASFIGRREQFKGNLLNHDFIHTKFFIKSREWAYEKEWRILSNASMVDNNFVSPVPKDAFRSIYIGCRANEKYEEELLLKAKKLNADIKLYKASVSTDSFALDFLQI